MGMEHSILEFLDSRSAQKNTVDFSKHDYYESYPITALLE